MSCAHFTNIYIYILFPTCRPGTTVQIRLPIGPPPGVESATNLNRPPEAPANNQPPAPRTRTIRQTFEVTVPHGVRPNQPFSLMAGGQRVLVTCPRDARYDFVCFAFDVLEIYIYFVTIFLQNKTRVYPLILLLMS